MRKKKRELINPYSKPWILGASVFILSLSIIFFFLIHNYKHLRLQAIINFQDNFRSETENKNNQNIDFIHHLSYSFFYSPNISRLRLADNLNSYDKILGMRTLNMMESTNEDIHSVYLYNPHMDMVFTSLEIGAIPWSDFHDKEIFDKNPQHFSKRYLPDKNIPVFSFIIMDDPYNYKEKGAMVVNIDAESFLTKIFSKQDFNEWIYLPSFDDLILSETEEQIPQKVFENYQDRENYYHDKKNKEIFFISYLPKIEAYLIQSAPIDAAFEELSYLRYFNFLVISTFVFSGIMIIYILYQEVFKPLHTAIKKSSNQENSKNIAIEEWIKEQTGREKLYKQTLEVHYLKRILLNSENVDLECIPQFKTISLSNPLTMILVENNRKSIKTSSVPNLLDSVQKNEHTILFLENKHEDKTLLVQAMQKAFPQKTLYFSIAFTDLREISLHYHHLSEMTKLNVFFPNTVHFEKDLIKKRNDLKSNLPKDDQIIHHLEAGEFDQAQKAFYLWQSKLEAFRLDTLLFLYNKLYLKCIILYSEHYEDDKMLNIESNENFDYYLNKSDDIQTINQLFFSIFRLITEKVKDLERSRFYKISSNIKKDIHQNYAHPNLSMKILAHKQELSPDYINRIFKEIESISIPEYINTYRIEQSKKLLIESDDAIKSIAKKVGVTNTSYFYTLFKKYTGMSPGQWRNKNQ